MTPQEFCDRYLDPISWNEQDLQRIIQKRLRRFYILAAPDEVRIKSHATTRRADLTTWLTIYEVKKYLTRDNIFHAVAQTELYQYYGGKVLGIIPKRRVVIGLAPVDMFEYNSARTVAEDFSKMGVKVIFINHSGLNFHVPELTFSLVAIALLMALIIGLAIASYFGV
jgi:hypothetical protein